MIEEFNKDYQVRSYEIDFRGRLKPVMLLNYLQDAAGEHAGLLGVSVVDLFKKNMTWVVSRYHLRIFDYPRWGETIHLATWPSDKHGLFALRDFEIKDRKGRLLVAATSSWMMLDLGNKKPVSVEERLAGFPKVNKRALSDEFLPLPPPENPESEIRFRIRMDDLDLNHHVNNTVYAQWAFEAVPAAVLKEHSPSEIEISFRREAFFGERILSRIGALESSEGPCYLHQISRESDGKELTRLRTSWKVF